MVNLTTRCICIEMSARLCVAVAAAAILWIRGAEALNVKLIPIETKTFDTDGATHEVSRYIVVPEGHVYSPEDAVTTSTDLHTSLGTDKNSTTSEDQGDSEIVHVTPKVSDDTHANIYGHHLKQGEPGASTSSSKSIILGRSNDNVNVSGNASHRRKGGAKYQSSNKGYSKVKVKVTHYQDPSTAVHHELNGEKIKHSDVDSDAYKLYAEKVQKEHPDMIAVNIHGSAEALESPLNGDNESVRSTDQSINEGMLDYHNGHYKTKIIRKKFKSPIKVTNVDSKDLPIKWDDFFKEPAITEKGKVPHSLPINETFTLPGKRGRFKIIHEDDEDYEYDSIEMPSLVRAKPKGQLQIHSTQKYYIGNNKAKKANKANTNIDASFKTLTINKDSRVSAVVKTKSIDSHSKTDNDDLKRTLTNTEMLSESPTIVSDNIAGISKINEERKENAQTMSLNNIKSGLLKDNRIGDEEILLRRTSTKNDVNTVLNKTNIQHTATTPNPFKSRTNITNGNWILAPANENSSANNNPRVDHQKIDNFETTKVTQNHTYNVASEPVLYNENLTLSSHRDEKENVGTVDKNSVLTNPEDEERTAQTDIMKYNISSKVKDTIKVIPLNYNTKLNGLSPNERITLLPDVAQTDTKKTVQTWNYRNNEVSPHGMVSNDNESEINSHIDDTVIQPTTTNTIRSTGVQVHKKKTIDNILTSSSKTTDFVQNIYEEKAKNKMLSDSPINPIPIPIVPAVDETRAITGLEKKHYNATPTIDISYTDENVPRVETKSILQTKHSKTHNEVLPEKVINEVITSRQKIVSGSTKSPEKQNESIDIIETMSDTESEHDTESPANNVITALNYLGRQRKSNNKNNHGAEIHVTHGENLEMVSKTSPLIKKVIQPAQSLASQCHFSIAGNVHQKDNLPKTYLQIHRDEQSYEDQIKQTDTDSAFKDTHTSSENEAVSLNKYEMNVRNDHNLESDVDGGIFQEFPNDENSVKMNLLTQKDDATKSGTDQSQYHLHHEYLKSSPFQTYDGDNNQVFYTRNDANQYSHLHKNIDSQQLQSFFNNLLSRNIIDELNAEYNTAGPSGDKNKIRRATILRHLQLLGVSSKITREQLNYLSQLIQQRETYLQNINTHIMYDINEHETLKKQIVARNNQKQHYYGPYTYAGVSQSEAEPDLRMVLDDAYLQQYLLEGYDASTLNKGVSDLSTRVLYYVAYLRRLGTPDADVLQFIAEAKKYLSMLLLRAFVVECRNKSYINSAQSIDSIAKQYLHQRPHAHYAIQYY